VVEKPKEIPKVEEKINPVEEIINTSKDTFVKVREIETTNNIPDYSLVIILTLIIILLLILIIIYGIYYINKFKNYIKKKMLSTEEDIHKNFEILEKDIDREIIISRKMKENEKLTNEEMASLVGFKKDIEKTEEIIEGDIKDIEKNS
jgi:biopolymer transport protein ExbB/TolQ